MLINANVSLFQFHEGPIKTASEVTKYFKGIMFQFHEGPIKTGLLQPRRQFHKVSIP